MAERREGDEDEKEFDEKIVTKILDSPVFYLGGKISEDNIYLHNDNLYRI